MKWNRRGANYVSKLRRFPFSYDIPFTYFAFSSNMNSILDLFRGKLGWFAFASAVFLGLDLLNVSRPNVYATSSVDVDGSLLRHKAVGHIDYQYGSVAPPLLFEDGYPLYYRVPFETSALLPNGSAWDFRPAALEASVKNDGSWVINYPAIVAKWCGIFAVVLFVTWLFSLLDAKPPTTK